MVYEEYLKEAALERERKVRQKGDDAPCLTVISPVYNEEENILPFHERLTKTLEGLGINYRIVLVNDGSSDRTPLLLDKIAEKDSHTAIIHLSRNFGHQPALYAGLKEADGDIFVFLDSDLQDPPEEITPMYQLWLKGYDTVYAVRTKRKEGIFKRFAYSAYYRILKKISHIDMPLDAGDFSLVDGKAIQHMKESEEYDVYLRGLRTWIGFNQTEHVYQRAERHAGESHYSFFALLKLALAGICGYSHLPLTLSFYIGLFLAAGTGLYAGVIVFEKIFFGIDLKGWASIVVLISSIASIQFLLLGITNYYIGIVLRQVQGRPVYIIGRIRGRLKKKDKKE